MPRASSQQPLSGKRGPILTSVNFDPPQKTNGDDSDDSDGPSFLREARRKEGGPPSAHAQRTTDSSDGRPRLHRPSHADSLGDDVDFMDLFNDQGATPQSDFQLSLFEDVGADDNEETEPTRLSLFADNPLSMRNRRASVSLNSNGNEEKIAGRPKRLSQSEMGFHSSEEFNDTGKSPLGDISADELLNFLTKGTSVDENKTKLLMEQVAKLSMGSEKSNDNSREGEAEGGPNQKFAVLREVVKLYMNEETSCKEGNDKEGNNKEGNDKEGNDDHRTAAKVRRSPSEPLQGPQRIADEVVSPQPHVYAAGDEARRKDMIKDDDKDVALMRIASLQPDDGAFIRRTTGKWTFARVLKPGSDCITFVVDTKGCTKGYKVKYWVSHIRTQKAQSKEIPQRPSVATTSVGP